MTPYRSWSVAVHFAFWIGLFTLVTGMIGMAINPDFAVGDDATAEAFIVDWNGWHAVAAITVGLPGVLVPWVPRFAVMYLLYRAVTDAGVALWAALDDNPLGLLYLPTSTDAVLHAVFAAIAAAGIALDARRSATTRVAADQGPAR